MITLVVGYHNLKQAGISLSIFRLDNQFFMDLCPKILHIKLIQVMKIIDTVLGSMPNR